VDQVLVQLDGVPDDRPSPRRPIRLFRDQAADGEPSGARGRLDGAAR
jgi:hypothetical protein